MFSVSLIYITIYLNLIKKFKIYIYIYILVNVESQFISMVILAITIPKFMLS
jgi:hypothetical protein